MLRSATFTCAFCGEEVESAFDPAQGRRARYVEDCQVCCRPNLLSLETDPFTGEVSVVAEPEMDR